MGRSNRIMFDGIARKYDFLNHYLSLGRDIHWRRRAVKLLPKDRVFKTLDLCGGTGDFLKEAQKNLDLHKLAIVGDFSGGMLAVSLRKNPETPCIQLDAMNIPFANESFDLILNGFGMRNLDSVEKGLDEVFRLLKPRGLFITLEFFRPENLFTRFFYGVLAPLFIPFSGALFGGHSDAYHYLVRSVRNFLSVGEYTDRMIVAGFSNTRVLGNDFGISHTLVGVKESEK